MEGDPAPGHVCWHDLNMCVRVLETDADSLSIFQTGPDGDPEKGTKRDRDEGV